MTARRKTLKSPVFLLFATMLFSLCAAASLGGIYRVYKVALAYESSTAEYAARRETGIFESRDYAEILKRFPPGLSKYETAEHYESALREFLGEGETELVRTGHDSFEILIGSKAVAFLTLECDKAAGEFGLDKWRVRDFKLARLPAADYEVYAPHGVSFLINGCKPNAEDLSESADPKSPFASLPDGLAAEPSVCCKLTGLYREPKITFNSKGKEALEISREENTFHITVEPAEKTVEQLTALGLAAAEGYAKFITNDAKLDEILPFFLPQSEFYAHLTQFYNGWYNEHEEFCFENAVFSDWRAYDERHVTCEISFDYRIKMGRREFTYPSRYDMYFVQNANGWLVCALVVKQEDNIS